jgi:hypothetical protein
MKLNTDERALLAHMRHYSPIQLSGCSREARRCLIDLGMREPPLVEVDGNWVSLTAEGRAATCVRNEGAGPLSRDNLTTKASRP